MRVSDGGQAPRHASRLERACYNTLFFATVTDEACELAARLPSRWRFALTADPAYAPAAAQVERLHAGGHEVCAWGDQEALGVDTILDFARLLGVAATRDTVFQAETAGQYDSSPHRFAVVGNPNAWTQVQRERAIISTGLGRFALIAECYDGRPDSYSSQGVPVASMCFGVALDGGARVPLADYLRRCPKGFRATYSIWHAAGLEAADWAILGAA